MGAVWMRARSELRSRWASIVALALIVGVIGVTVNRAKILEGRMLDPTSPDEIVPSSSVATDLGLHVGETVRIEYGGLLSPGRTPPGFVRPPPAELHVVGIAAIPSMFQPLAG